MDRCAPLSQPRAAPCVVELFFDVFTRKAREKSLTHRSLNFSRTANGYNSGWCAAPAISKIPKLPPNELTCTTGALKTLLRTVRDLLQQYNLIVSKSNSEYLLAICFMMESWVWHKFSAASNAKRNHQSAGKPLFSRVNPPFC
ncbi:unnamed protein product [Leptidea sinapis]|uniref:Uncharacterized protein n=1 Tax=Leptidea sinapis TaxID=189913 RepID=A0A5E4R3K3_9NEOP|nr:unnamed protein product [Leptidea sinapis]